MTGRSIAICRGDRPERPNYSRSFGRELQFDGLTARFERGVEAKLTNQYLRTDRLNVTFTQQVAFGNDRDQPDVQRIDCFDGVFLESRTLKEGALTSVERMTV